MCIPESGSGARGFSLCGAARAIRGAWNACDQPGDAMRVAQNTNGRREFPNAQPERAIGSTENAIGSTENAIGRTGNAIEEPNFAFGNPMFPIRTRGTRVGVPYGVHTLYVRCTVRAIALRTSRTDVVSNPRRRRTEDTTMQKRKRRKHEAHKRTLVVGNQHRPFFETTVGGKKNVAKLDTAVGTEAARISDLENSRSQQDA